MFYLLRTVKMAANAGVRVIATTKDRDGFSIAEKLGAERCEIDRRDLSKHIPEAKKIDAVLDLVGNTVMLDSLAMLRRGGRLPTKSSTASIFFASTMCFHRSPLSISQRSAPSFWSMSKRSRLRLVAITLAIARHPCVSVQVAD